MKKLKLYLETTIPNYVFAEDTPEKQNATLKFWDKIKTRPYEVFVSEVVVAEIEKTRDPSKRGKLLRVIEGLPLLELTESCRKFAEVLINEKVIPAEYEPDALHIALGVINQMDAIVSWNLEHIVNIETKLAVRRICQKLGYREIEIVTPEEVITND
jgi:predicted nucleic acid-binding protein